MKEEVKTYLNFNNETQKAILLRMIAVVFTETNVTRFNECS